MRHVGGQRRSALLAVAALVLVGCSDAGSSDTDHPAKRVSVSEDSTDVTAIEEALGLLPPDVGLVDFSSDRHSAERLELFDDEASSSADLGRSYADRLAEVDKDDLATVSELAGDVADMTDGGAAFSQLDVRWSMSASVGAPMDDDGRSVKVFRIVDGVDMQDVLADLEDAGFERSTSSGWDEFHLDGQLSDHIDVIEGTGIGGRYPDGLFPDVSVHADSHLVALGDASLLDVSGSGTALDGLIPQLGDDDPAELERLLLTPPAWFTCWLPVDRTTDGRATADAIADWARRFGTEELGLPGATMLTWVPGEDVVHRSYFDDATTARRALAARTRLYREAERSEEPLGVLMPAEGNASPYEPGWTMTRQAQVIEVLHNRTDPAAAVETYLKRGLGFDACGAPGMFS